jgi:hypothetical protein
LALAENTIRSNFAIGQRLFWLGWRKSSILRLIKRDVYLAGYTVIQLLDDMGNNVE